LDKIIIEGGKFSLKQKLRELIEYRELITIFAYRDIKVKYAQTAIGILWAVINPLFEIILLSFVFGLIAKVNTGLSNVPHLIYTAAGMCSWTYFSSIFSSASQSIIGAQSMVKKIYFPRLILPISKAITALIDFAIMFILVLILILYYNINISSSVIFLPLLRLGMYATPIAYSSSSVPDKYQAIFHINPMVGIVQGFRWSLIGGPPPSNYAYFSFAIITVFFVSGIIFFIQIERKIADII